MLNKSEREQIRRTYYLEKKSIRRIAQEAGYSRDTVQRALVKTPRFAYHLSRPRPAPRLGPIMYGLQNCWSTTSNFPPNNATPVTKSSRS